MSVTAASATWVGGMAFEPRARVRLALLGAGGRGRSLMRGFLATGAVDVVAICDPDEAGLLKARAVAEQGGAEGVDLYGGADPDVQALLGRGDIDLVCVAASWDAHTPLALAAMRSGMHVAVEVPAATTLDDCWELVRVSEQTRRHCVMLENDCYGENQLLVLNMVRDGILGEVLHAEGAYIHDLRELLFSSQGEGRWRREPHTRRDGNLYPTHAVGPVASWVGINRRDRFDHLVSMSTAQRGLDLWREKHVPEVSETQRERYVCGDLNTSLLKTAGGVTVVIQHDVVNALPKDGHRTLIGTRGSVRGLTAPLDVPSQVFIEGMEEERFYPLDIYRDRYQHRLWRELHDRAAEVGGHHGGMDFVMISRLVECMRLGEVPDMDVYDAATWSAIGPLSEASVSGRSAAVDFPDFTRGHWQSERRNLV